MLNKVEDMIVILEGTCADASKADEGNKAAAQRLRAGIAQIPPTIKDLKKQSLGK